MDITFERGDPRRPRGHALAYFRTQAEPGVVYAAYIIVLPISMDFAKYVPPFLASHLGSIPTSELSAFALPPVPEEIGSYEELERLAEIREDDLLFAGTMRSFDVPEMMQAMGEVVQQYAATWSEHSRPDPAIESAREIEDESLGVNEVLYSLMSGRDRLAELSKLVGKLRFAVEGDDQATGDEARADIDILSRYLPEHYYIPSLLHAVMDSSASGAQLAQLHLDRCYKLSNGDEAGARALDEKIEALKGSN